MKTEDSSKVNNDNSQPENSEILMDRREVLSKAGWYALSAATMMVLMKSQPAKANSYTPTAPTAVPPPSGSTWQRTTRS